MRVVSNLKKKVCSVAIVFSIVVLALLCASCAPQQRELTSVGQKSERSDSGSAVQVIFSMDSSCEACHETSMKNNEIAGTVASVHARQETMTCITCHQNESDLVAAHEGIDAQTPEPTRLKKASITDETCLSCHGSYQDLAQKTASSRVLTDVNGRSVNPHETKQLGEEHTKDITCQKCHGQHKEKTDVDVQAYCYNCHHMKVYECNTCHEYHA